MKHLCKCFNYYHNKVLYYSIAMICLNMCFGRYFDVYAVNTKNNLKRDYNKKQEESGQPNGPESFICHARGSFENANNRNTYWYCDMTPDGGFVAIRRSCPYGKSYDSTEKKCALSKPTKKIGHLNIHKFLKPRPKISYVFVVPETTAQEYELEPIGSEMDTEFNEECTETTTCTQKSRCRTATTCPTTTTCRTTPKIEFKCNSEGAFPDPKSCSSFFICHKKRNSPRVFKKIKVRCPNGMSFDFKLGWCSPQARARCKTFRSDELNNFLRLVNLGNAKDSRSLHRQKINKNKLFRIIRNDKQGNNMLPIHYMKKRHVNYKRVQAFRKGEDLPESFQCSGKGRFPDPHNRNDYYICYPKEVGGYLTLKMKCPGRTSFDANHLTCTPSRQELKALIKS